MEAVAVIIEDKPLTGELKERLTAALQDKCWNNRPGLKAALEFLRDHGRITPDDKRQLNFWTPNVYTINEMALKGNLGFRLVISQPGWIIKCECA
jgi:hypothetical protein